MPGNSFYRSRLFSTRSVLILKTSIGHKLLKKTSNVPSAIEIHSGNFEVFDSHKTLEQLGLRSSRDENEQYQLTRWRREGLSRLRAWLPRELSPRCFQRNVYPTWHSQRVLASQHAVMVTIGMVCILTTLRCNCSLTKRSAGQTGRDPGNPHQPTRDERGVEKPRGHQGSRE